MAASERAPSSETLPLASVATGAAAESELAGVFGQLPLGQFAFCAQLEPLQFFEADAHFDPLQFFCEGAAFALEHEDPEGQEEPEAQAWPAWHEDLQDPD